MMEEEAEPVVSSFRIGTSDEAAPST